MGVRNHKTMRSRQIYAVELHRGPVSCPHCMYGGIGHKFCRDSEMVTHAEFNKDKYKVQNTPQADWKGTR